MSYYLFCEKKLSILQTLERVTDKFFRGVAEAPEPTEGREGPSTSGENPGGIFERVPEKLSGARLTPFTKNKKVTYYSPNSMESILDMSVASSVE